MFFFIKYVKSRSSYSQIKCKHATHFWGMHNEWDIKNIYHSLIIDMFTFNHLHMTKALWCVAQFNISKCNIKNGYTILTGENCGELLNEQSLRPVVIKMN